MLVRGADDSDDDEDEDVDDADDVDGWLSDGGGGIRTKCCFADGGRRKRFIEPRCGCWLPLGSAESKPLPEFNSDILFNLVMVNGFSSANGMTPLSRRFDLL